MAFLIPFKQYTLDDLPDYTIDPIKLRNNTKILIVDDEEFKHEQELRKVGFNISLRKCWSDITEAEPFDVIVSDNNGVSDAGGAFFLQQIHKKYPQKSCIIYSASPIDGRGYQSDGIKQIKKEDSISTWVTALAEAAFEVHDPKCIWNHVEIYLKGQGVSRRVLRRLENRYVRNLIHGKVSAINLESQRYGLSTEVIELLKTIFKLGIEILALI